MGARADVSIVLNKVCSYLRNGWTPKFGPFDACLKKDE